jgi:hypothetical protein
MKKYSTVLIGILLLLFAVQAATATATVQDLDMNDAVTASDAGAGDLTGNDILIIVVIIFALIGLIVVLAIV